MKLLVILCSHELNVKWCDNIKILNDYMMLTNMDVNYCGISNQDDFHNYESIISFKYKIINNKQQFSKICDFISDKRSEMNYEWYMKIRPDIKLLEQIVFNELPTDSINARARMYYGPKCIRYGMSINGEGIWKNIGECSFSVNEHHIILDDQIFIFHKNVIDAGGFNRIDFSDDIENEWRQTEIYNMRGIPLNVIGIYLELTKYNSFSGHLLTNKKNKKMVNPIKMIWN
jgi:hypothetical protein